MQSDHSRSMTAATHWSRRRTGECCNRRGWCRRPVWMCPSFVWWPVRARGRRRHSVTTLGCSPLPRSRTSPGGLRRRCAATRDAVSSSVYSISATVRLLTLNNFIHHKSGSNEYKDKQTNITRLTLSSTYINRLYEYIELNMMVNDVSECVYKLSYQPNCTRLKISFLICLTEHLVIQI